MPIQFIGSAIGATTATIPTHRAGDLILAFAYNDAAVTVPSLPSGYTNVPNNASGANSNAHRAFYKIASASAETIGTLSNTTQVVVHVYRGVDQTTPVGAGQTFTNVADIIYPALTLQVTDGTSWVAAIHGRRTGNVESATVPPGTVLRSDTGTSGAGRVLGYDTNQGVASWPQLATGGNNQFRYRSASIELRAAAAQGASGQLSTTLGAATLASTGRLSIRAALARTLGALTTVSAAKLIVRGQGGGRLANAILAGTGRLLNRGTASVALGALTLAARSASQGRAQLASTLADLAATSSGRSARRAAAAIRLGEMTSISSGRSQDKIAGRLSGVLASAAISATGQVRARGAFGVALDAVGLVASGGLRIAGSLAARLGDLVLRAASGRPVRTPPARVVRPAMEPRLITPPSEPRLVRVLSKGDDMFRWPPKDPDDVLDYAIDFAAWLEGDTIATVEWAVPSGLQVDREVQHGGVATIWLSGGVLGTYPKITCRVTTEAGRQFDQTVVLDIISR